MNYALIGKRILFLNKISINQVILLQFLAPEAYLETKYSGSHNTSHKKIKYKICISIIFRYNT